MLSKIMTIKLTQKYVRSLFDYKDGNLYWKVRKAYRIKIGDLAGYVNITGYQEVIIDGKSYKAHRLIFLYHHGYLPKFLDHIDCNKLNNDINNLREATKSQNKMNQRKIKDINGNQHHQNIKVFAGINKLKNGALVL